MEHEEHELKIEEIPQTYVVLIQLECCCGIDKVVRKVRQMIKKNVYYNIQIISNELDIAIQIRNLYESKNNIPKGLSWQILSETNRERALHILCRIAK